MTTSHEETSSRAWLVSPPGMDRVAGSKFASEGLSNGQVMERLNELSHELFEHDLELAHAGDCPPNLTCTPDVRTCSPQTCDSKGCSPALVCTSL